MPLYFLHIHNSSGSAQDDEGQELTDLAQARAKAVEGIRSLLAEEVLGGSMDFRGRIEIVGDAGQPLAVVPFRDAVAVQFDEGAT
jgi:hypothetical protein